MCDVYRLRNTIRRYDWGSKTVLAELLGRPSPSREPEAELWMGAHPSAPSEALVGERWVSLRDLPGGRDLPYLFKVLAVERPLSIQAHPDREQAVAGFRREEAAGIPRDAFQRNYRDDQPKPEILCAVTPFRMLRGFRAPSEILGSLERFRLRALLPESEVLATAPKTEGLEGFLRAWMGLDESRLATLLEALTAHCEKLGSGDEVASWILRLAEAHPNDRGVMAPLFLHLAHLDRGETVYTGPGVLHTYLEGVGVELMSNSDNVVRGGLSSKHCDETELLRILRFRSDAPHPLTPRVVRPGVERFDVPDTGLVLNVLDLAEDRPIPLDDGRGMRILLCTEGRGNLLSNGKSTRFEKGDSLLLTDASRRYRLEGAGRLFLAGAAAA